MGLIPCTLILEFLLHACIADHALPMMCSALQFGMVCTLLAVAMVKPVNQGS